jgi:hypothetical protein
MQMQTKMKTKTRIVGRLLAQVQAQRAKRIAILEAEHFAGTPVRQFTLSRDSSPSGTSTAGVEACDCETAPAMRLRVVGRCRVPLFTDTPPSFGVKWPPLRQFTLSFAAGEAGKLSIETARIPGCPRPIFPRSRPSALEAQAQADSCCVDRGDASGPSLGHKHARAHGSQEWFASIRKEEEGSDDSAAGCGRRALRARAHAAISGSSAPWRARADASAATGAT